MRAVLALGLLARIAAADCPHVGKQLAIARGPVVVDGVLDDATWQHACFAEDFEQKTPRFGAPPSHPVKVAVAIDGKTLYVGARMWAGSRAEIDDALTQRDDTAQAERFIVSLDPSHTRRLAYSFAVTAQGVRADWIHTDDTEGSRDMSWNPVWIAKTKMFDDGWSVEMAIPLSQLRLPREPAASWAIDFDWYIPHTTEDVFWRAVPPDRTAWASYFGELVDLPPVRPGLALELLPYLASRVVLDGKPGTLGHRWLAAFDAGLDAKLRPLPGLAISATINPDFGQVEADPAFVNLTAYEVTLPEKRPFFIENNALFANASSSYFYSRRIGGLPRLLPPADAIDLPPAVRILGAVAAGGYIEARTQVAAVTAVTDETSADAIVNGRHTSLVVSPLSAWAAARVEHQIGPSVLGATATFVERALGGTGLASRLPRTAFAADSDLHLRTDDGIYELIPYGGATGVFGEPGAIATIEQTSTHYFQRPDEPYLHVDTDARQMLGWHGGLIVKKRAGMWQLSGFAEALSPGFEHNDLGVLPRADDITTSTVVHRIVTTPTPRLFAWDTSAQVGASMNFGGLVKPASIAGTTSFTFPGFSTLSINARAITPGGNDDLTRGGPTMRTGWAGSFTLSASTPNGRAHQLSGSLELDGSPTLQQGVIARAQLATRILPALRLDITPSLVLVETHRQYVATVTAAGGGAQTYGARYVFGHLRRREAAMELRATWSLSPDLVITLYAQPFWSRGTYDTLGELAAAGTDQIRWYDTTVPTGDTRTIAGEGFAIAEPDYQVTSLRSTAVLRWELAPGSTLFAVWQEARDATTALHTFALKLSYWFG